MSDMTNRTNSCSAHPMRHTLLCSPTSLFRFATNSGGLCGVPLLISPFGYSTYRGS